MELIQLTSFAFVSALLVMSPGPNGLLIARTVPLSGRLAGYANVAGFVVAFYLHGSLSILGISILLLQSSQAFFILKMLGAAYLCWIGLRALIAAWQSSSAAPVDVPGVRPVSLRRAFLEGFLTNALNPKVSMFYLAAFPQFIPADGTLSQAYLLVFIHSMLNLVWFGAMVVLLARLGRWTNNPRIVRGLNALTGVVFIGFGAKLASLRP